MADIVHNISLGRVVEKCVDDANQILIVLLQTAEADAAIRDHNNLALLIAGSSVEATFTDYARKTALVATTTVDDTNERVDVDIPDQTWTGAGGAANNTLVDLLVCYEESGGSADTDRTVMTQHDFAVTTDSSDLTVQFNSAGFFRAE